LARLTVYQPLPQVSVITLETGFMSTQELLSSLGQNYYLASEDLVKALDKDLSFDRFTSLVTQFTESLGLARWLLGEGADEVIRRTPGLIGYYVKKGSWYCWSKRTRPMTL